MADLYEYRKLVRRHWYGKFRLRRRYILAFIALVLAAAGIILFDLINSEETKKPASAVQTTQVGDVLNTFKSDIFEFKDTGNWVFSKQDSNSQKYVYFKYRGVQPVGRLIFYVNQVPPPLELATSRVVPIRIVNHNRFDVINIYGHCVTTYATGEPRIVKAVTIEGAEMLCDPDTPQYTVVLSEVSGNWELNMQRKNGESVKFVITFRDITIDPGPESILTIAKTFQAL